MKKLVLYWIFFYALISCNRENEIWELTFSDEFNDSTVNFEIWSPKFSWGQHFSGKEQCLFIENAFEIENGILKIKCEKKDTFGKVYNPDWSETLKKFEYTSGHLYSRNSFSQQYGYFEIRAKSAFGKGFNSAFWMMAYSGWPPEIDIFEILGKDPNLLRTTNHFIDRNGKHSQNGRFAVTNDLSSEFNIFGMEWNPTEIIWFLNGKEVFRSNKGIPQEPMYLIISHALGSNFSDYADANTPFPAFFEIDYVRVYKKSNSI